MDSTGRVGRLWAVYTGLRLAVFLAVAGVLFLVFRLNGFPLLLVALLVSSVASLFLLRAQRDALVAAQQARVQQRREERERRQERLGEEPAA